MSAIPTQGTGLLSTHINLFCQLSGKKEMPVSEGTSLVTDGSYLSDGKSKQAQYSSHVNHALTNAFSSLW